MKLTGVLLAVFFVIRLVRDDEVRLAALRAWDVDLIERTPLQFVERIKRVDLEDLKVTVAPASRVLGLRLNLSKPPFDRPESRPAIALAIDKEVLVREGGTRERQQVVRMAVGEATRSAGARERLLPKL